MILLEAESDAGGLCRSRKGDGYPLDIGGGHFLDVRRPQVNDFLFSFLPEIEWERFERDSRIEVQGYMVGYPFEANIWQLPINDQVEYIKSIAYAGCNQGEPMPADFVSWITWKLGDLIAENYMLPYNRKMFGKNLNILGTDWLEKLTITGDKYSADKIIATVPWKEFVEILGMPEQLKNIITDLKHTSIVVKYCSKHLNTRAHWIYCSDQQLAYHCILVRHNLSHGSGYWTETNIECVSERIDNGECFINTYAYPLNSIGKNEKMKKLLTWCSENGVYGIWRRKMERTSTL